MINPALTIRTGRLSLTPVGGADLPDLRAIKADPQVFAVMLGGVRNAAETAEDLARDVMAWGQHGFGMWAIRETVNRRFAGITGLDYRPDRRGFDFVAILARCFLPEVNGERRGARANFHHILRFPCGQPLQTVAAAFDGDGPFHDRVDPGRLGGILIGG